MREEKGGGGLFWISRVGDLGCSSYDGHEN